MPTAICKLRLKSGSAPCDLHLAVEVRLCPLDCKEEAAGEEAEEAMDEEENSSDKI